MEEGDAAMNRKEIDKLWNKALRDAVEAGEMYTRYHFAALVKAAVCESLAAEAEKNGNSILAAQLRARGQA